MIEILLSEMMAPPTLVDMLTISGTIPEARMSSSCVVINGKMYIMGGWSGSAQLKDILVYDPSTNVCSFLRNADEPRHSFGMCADGSTGFYAIYGATPPYKNSFYSYNVASNTGSTTSLNNSGVATRQEFVLKKIGGYGYIFGGWDQNNNVLNDTLRWTVGTPYITNLNPSNPPPPRRNPGSELVGDYIYVLGGFDGVSVPGVARRNDFWRYNRLNNTWVRLSDFPIGIASTVMLSAKGKLYVFGGDTAEGPTNKMWCYEPTTNTWSELPVPQGVAGLWRHCGCVINNALYYFGGVSSGPVYQNKFYRFVP